MARKLLYVTYGITSYLVFFGVFLNLILFSGNLLVPVSVDKGLEMNMVSAILVNIILIAQFGVSHSLMARKWFKDWWTQIIPVELERSTYVLVSSLSVGLIIWFWKPISDVIIWDISGAPFAIIAWALFLSGWGLVFVSSLVINHFDLFGLRQVYLYARDLPYTPLEFKVSSLYRVVRHPLQLGIVLGVWAHPTMTVSHLFFSVGFTIYILIGLYFEERDLIRDFGEKYIQYRLTTPKLIPFLPKSKPDIQDTVMHSEAAGD
ncbi:MAG: methanethiol S-methyltransferase [Chloroflexota bacterium]